MQVYFFFLWGPLKLIHSFLDLTATNNAAPTYKHYIYLIQLVFCPGSTTISHSSATFSHASGSALGTRTFLRAGPSSGLVPCIRCKARQKWTSEGCTANSSASYATRGADDHQYGDPLCLADPAASMSGRTSTFGSAAAGSQ